MANRYLVFGFADYYPGGGFEDFVEEVASEQDFDRDKYMDANGRCKYDNLELITLKEDGSYARSQEFYRGIDRTTWKEYWAEGSR